MEGSGCNNKGKKYGGIHEEFASRNINRGISMAVLLILFIVKDSEMN